MGKQPNQPGHIAQNGDVCGRDNDGDGRIEDVYVKPSKDGGKSHYRARPKKK
jgi:hypothetical protein